ncbi:MAG TPA: class I SAM-dependent methyltransferase [Pyrinomonadaceae bacterium]|jgi:SAM-dependent methyltransferase
MDTWTPERLHFAQAQCKACGILAAQPQASEIEIENYYKHYYYQEQWSDPEAYWVSNTEMFSRYEFPLIKQLWADSPPPAAGEVAEVGCGYGITLDFLQRAGYRVRGCELSSKAVAFCRSKGLDVVEGKSPGMPLPRQAFDMVVTRHVIEHVSDPRLFVEELVQLAKPGGLIVIVTEDAYITQYAWDRFRHKLAGKIPNYRSSTDHTFVFQGGHLRTLLADAGCGDVRTKSFSYGSMNESWHWRLYKNLFRTLDKLTGHGEFLMAVGCRK